MTTHPQPPPPPSPPRGSSTPTTPRDQVVWTSKAHCRDCYRCLRACPVKAISLREGQAQVEPELCIACGTCIRECPQGAKRFRGDLERAQEIMASGAPVGISVAPSFVALFEPWQRRRLPSALRGLGFRWIGETAVGAWYVARETADYVRDHPERPHVATACPVMVRWVERYARDLVPNLVPVVSPMQAHARMIRERLGDDGKVIFAGPCVGKKAEAERTDTPHGADCVLTFGELLEWFERDGIDLARCEESEFDESPPADARLFPLEGGSLRTGGLTTDLLAGDVVAVSGFDEMRQALESLRTGATGLTLVEPLFCAGGCINGPALPDSCQDAFSRRSSVLDYARKEPAASENDTSHPELKAQFSARGMDNQPLPSEDEIREVLAKTGKFGPDDTLDCGACGYPTCRDKAIAVLRGMAELQMCLPHMRRLAEQRTDRIIQTSPNGIVILDPHLNILHMNPAFRRLFMCSEALLGEPVLKLMDPDCFERVADGEETVRTTVRHEKYHRVCHQIVYPLREEEQIVGIFVDVTDSRANREKLAKVRAQTVVQARELLEHQLQMAQTIARYLGDSTAQGEALVDRLMTIAGGGGDDPLDEPLHTPTPSTGRRSIPWDTRTSK